MFSGTSAISPLTGDLVVTTFNQQIHSWPIRHSTGAWEDLATSIATGQERFDDLRPNTAPSVTPQGVIIFARDNYISMICPGGRPLQDLKLRK